MKEALVSTRRIDGTPKEPFVTQEENQSGAGKASSGGAAGNRSSKKRSKKKSGRSNQNSTPAAAPETVVAAAPAQVAGSAADGNAQGKGSGIAVLALVLSALALAGAGYAWYQTAVNARLAGGEQTNRLNNVESRFADIATEQTGVAAQIDQIRSRVADAEAGVADQISQFRQQIASSESGVAEQVSQIKQLIGNTETALGEQISAIRNTVSEQQQQISTSLASAEQQVAEQTTAFRDEFNQLSSSVGEVKSELGTSVDRWSQREVEHLLIIANQRLNLGQDPQAARQAMRIADARLEAMNDPALLSIREQLSSEIASLDAVAAPDIAQAMGTITLLSKTLDDLPLIGATNVPEAAESGDEDGAGGSTGDEGLASIGKSLFSDLSKLVQVEKDGEPVAPSISPEFAQMVVARGRLMLEGAQVALVRTLPEVYDSRLSAAGEWIQENFEADNELTQNWLRQLDEVKSMAPAVEFPDISGSLDQLRSVMGAEGQG